MNDPPTPAHTTSLAPEWREGDRVNWNSPRGNYGFTICIAGIVRKVQPRRVMIEVAKREAGRWRRHMRWVAAERLSPRSANVPALDDRTTDETR